MSETPHRTPAQRRAARVVTATVVAGGLALAGGSAYAQNRDAGSDRPAPVSAAPVSAAPAAVEPVAVEPAAVEPAAAAVEPAAVVVEPAPAASTTPADRPAADLVRPDSADDTARQTYFAAGYTYDDAVVLGAQWNLDPFQAKAEAGRRLTAGEALPVAPGSSPVADTTPVDGDGSVEAVDAFFAAGHDYDDAVALAAVWNVEPYEAKVTAGQRILAGETLPVTP